MIIPPEYRQDPNGSCYLINPKPFDYTAEYWGKDGRSSLEDQRFNVDGFKNDYDETKTEAVLKYCIGKTLLEIGCAPGAFLKRAKAEGFNCVGIAPENGMAGAIQDYCECPVIEGYFPEAISDRKDKFDIIVAMDVFEHIQDGEKFIKDCRAHLNKDGNIVLMLPLITNKDEFRPQDFCEEHVCLYHIDHIKEWLSPTMIEKWVDGHWIVVIEKI